MDAKTIFTKTAKGLTQVNQKTVSLSREMMKVLKAIDGKSTLPQLSEKADLPLPVLEKVLLQLKKDGFIKIFEVRQEQSGAAFGGGDDDDFDFTKPAMASTLRQPVAKFGPSPLRAAGGSEQVERAVPPAEAEAQRQAAAKAQAEARARAEREMQARAKLEVEARARREAEARAMEEAKRAQAAAEKARVELEAKLAEEKRKRDALAAQRAQLSQEQAAKATQEQRALAEARAKAEAEAKALAAARAKAETEAKALADARAKAEAAAQKQAEEVASAQRALRAQLKAEIEAKVRSEMEELLKSDIDESARAEVEAAVRAEAQDEARRMLQEQLASEQHALSKAEADAKVHAEVEAKRMLAEQETRLRGEMAARIAVIEAAKQKAEDEARRMAESQAEVAAQAAAAYAEKLKQEEATHRRALEERMKAEAAMQAKLAQEKQARIEAQAKALVEANQRAKATAEAQAALTAERKAREEAEAKARREAMAREIASRAVAEQVAEKQKLAELAEQRIAAEREARERAEAKAYADEREAESVRQAQLARLKELAAQREHEEAEAAANAATNPKRRPKPRREIHWWRWIAMGIFLLVVGVITAIHLVPLGAVNTRLEKALSAWLHDEVSSASLRVALFPRPYVKLDQIATGKLLDAKASGGKIYMDLGALFDERFAIRTLELEGLTIAADALPRALLWANPENRGKQIEIENIVLRDVRIEVRGVPISPFDAEIKLNRAGKIVQATARARDTKWTLEVAEGKPQKAEDGTLLPTPRVIKFSARNFNMPIGLAIPLANFTADGTWQDDVLSFPKIVAGVMEGQLEGPLKVTMREQIAIEAELTAQRIKADELFPNFTRDVSVNGRIEGNFAVAASAPTVGTLLSAPVIVGSFTARDGSFSNLDLVQAMRTPGAVGGNTKFAELTGKVKVADGEIRYESLKLTGGLLAATGNLIISNKGAISGNATAELRSAVSQDRANFSLSGTVGRPQARRGG